MRSLSYVYRYVRSPITISLLGALFSSSSSYHIVRNCNSCLSFPLASHPIYIYFIQTSETYSIFLSFSRLFSVVSGPSILASETVSYFIFIFVSFSFPFAVVYFFCLLYANSVLVVYILFPLLPFISHSTFCLPWPSDLNCNFFFSLSFPLPFSVVYFF